MPFEPHFAFHATVKVVSRTTGYDYRLPGPHVHEGAEIGFCHKGKGFFSVGERVVPFRGGDLSVIAAEVPHIAYYASECVWTWISFSPVKLLAGAADAPELLDISFLANPSFPCVLRSTDHPGLAALVRQVIREWEEKRSYYREAIRGLALAVLAVLRRSVGRAAGRPASRSALPEHSVNRISPALEYIHAHFADEISVEQLAQQVFMSPTHFRRVFRSAVGTAPHDYLTEYRLAVACAKLADRSIGVEQAGYACGFGDSSSFRRTFKERIGVSPRQWRRREIGAG